MRCLSAAATSQQACYEDASWLCEELDILESMSETAPNSAWPSPRVVYHRRYNITAFGLERLHPFDSKKYGRAWDALRRTFGRRLDAFWVKPTRAIRRRELAAVHDSAYLRKLRQAKFVAAVVEIPQVARLPGWAIDWLILRPMRWAVRGTVVAAEQAILHGLAINLAGGYHHASRDHGHGFFCAYTDVALAVDSLRRQGKLKLTDRLVYIDLDAHQGNGVARCFLQDSRFFIYDQYNQFLFPHDTRARRRIDCDVPLPTGVGSADYRAL